MAPNSWMARTALIVVISFLCGCFSCGCSSEVNYTPPPDSRDTAINHYSFGKIVVDGKTYEHDILILPDKTVKGWQVKVNHFVQLADIQPIIGDSTKELIIGIGANKVCEVAQDVIDYAKSKGIRLHMLSTFDAVTLFNSMSKEGLSACFHLNC